MSKLVSRFVTALFMIGYALPVEESVSQGRIALAVPSFTNENAELLQVTGDALVKEGRLRLTRDEHHLSGAALYHTAQSLADNRSFSAYFAFRMWRPSGAKEVGADGIVFVLQNSMSSLPGLGQDMGYKGAGHSLNIEFDTFQNSSCKDPDSNHVGVNLDGNSTSVSTVKAPVTLNDGKVYHAWVDYDGDQHLLEIRLSSSAERPEYPLLAHTLDLTDVLNSDVFVGFTSATGGFRQQHEIHSFFFHNELISEGIDTSVTEYSME
jgi:hypothetical protein